MSARQSTDKEDDAFTEWMDKKGIMVKQVYELGVAVDYIASEYLPEDIFTDEQLETWALSHGWVKDE